MDIKIDLSIIETKLKEAREQRSKGISGVEKSQAMILEIKEKITEMYATIYRIEGMIEAYESLLPKKEDTKNGQPI